MAEIKRDKDGRFETISATSTAGLMTPIHGRGIAAVSNLLMALLMFGGDPRPTLSLTSVFNVKNSRDGANSLVIFSGADSGRDGKVRVRETPEELRSIFREAGLEAKFPAIQETRWSRVCQTLFGRPWHPPVAP